MKHIVSELEDCKTTLYTSKKHNQLSNKVNLIIKHLLNKADTNQKNQLYALYANLKKRSYGAGTNKKVAKKFTFEAHFIPIIDFNTHNWRLNVIFTLSAKDLLCTLIRNPKENL